MLTGTFPRSVDDKQRIAIPKRIRESLNLGEPAELFIAPGTDGSLTIYTKQSLEAFASRSAAASPTQQDVRAFNRLFYAQIERVEVDAQGRIRIPPALAQLAHVEREAILLGVQDHMELWDRERWEQYLAARRDQYDALAERALGEPSALPILQQPLNTEGNA